MIHFTLLIWCSWKNSLDRATKTYALNMIAPLDLRTEGRTKCTSWLPWHHLRFSDIKMLHQNPNSNPSLWPNGMTNKLRGNILSHMAYFYVDELLQFCSQDNRHWFGNLKRTRKENGGATYIVVLSYLKWLTSQPLVTARVWQTPAPADQTFLAWDRESGRGSVLTSPQFFFSESTEVSCSWNCANILSQWGFWLLCVSVRRNP